MTEKPLPTIDPSSRPFWEAAKAHRLAIQRCEDCGAYIFYPRTICTTCSSDQLAWTESSGEGLVYSYTISYRPAGAGFKEDVPYVVAIIELKEGPRLLSNIVTDDLESVTIGSEVRVVFDDVTDEVTLPKFILTKR